MSLRTMDMSEIIIAFEHVLKIEQEQDTGKAILSARQRLEGVYQVQLKDDLFAIQKGSHNNDAVQQLLSQITVCLKDLALLHSISLFDKKYAINLYDVNYLGFAKDTLQVSLRYLQDEVLYEKRHSFIPAIIKGTSRIESSRAKRLLTIMLLLESLGVKEGVALIASYLFLGSL